MRVQNRYLPLDPEEVHDPALRTNLFRAIGNDLVVALREHHCSDGPGEVARLLEKAYQAGISSAPSGKSPSRAAKRKMTDKDLPSSALWGLEKIRKAALGYPSVGIDIRSPTSPPYARLKHPFIVLFPKASGFSASLSKDDWVFTGVADRPHILSNKHIGPLLKKEVLEDIGYVQGRRTLVFTEWGYELLITGETSLPSDRVTGTSKTYADWCGLVGRQEQQPLGVGKGKPFTLTFHDD